ncbi:uncharacterized protein Dwil_GK22139 [Drosophila willistoni]|uniref:PHTF1/2 N-terminal domain-containing protein n=1 Tax=Drosophila willistoni TaxID=7260 RepID=B4MY48_DROWI|nr:protein phtf [Drosophila willistoni]EDW77037.1 uncharacterized protein Dwil_GK22139 [Drosophila willistoni]
MKLDEIVAWYQKRIGTYDKQEWEKTVEQRILDGFNSVNLKNTKLKTELIDVDLVRGSTFPKAKPKQSLLTVIRLAILRYLLLPLYAQWWVKQTTPNAFGFILLLYMTQLINWAIYILHSNRIVPLVYERQVANATDDGTNGTAYVNTAETDSTEEHDDLLSALLIPSALSLLISLIHSQIVATNTSGGAGGTGCKANKSKLRRFSLSNFSDKATGTREQPRIRRRKKFVRVRQPECNDVSQPSSNTSLHNRRSNIPKIAPVSAAPIVSSAKVDLQLPSVPLPPVIIKRNDNEETYLTTTAITTIKQPIATSQSQSLSEPLFDLRLVGGVASESPKKRSVNWHTPIQIYNTYEQAPLEQPSTSSAQYAPRRHLGLGEDDGFESLNGKSSSGEDNNHSPLPNSAVGAGPAAPIVANPQPSQLQPMRESSQLRLRLNVANNPTTATDQPTGNKPIRGRQSSTSCEESDECDDDAMDLISSPPQECTTSATDWLGVTTNSEDCSYTSELDQSDSRHQGYSDDELGAEVDVTPTTILNPHNSLDRISCTIWDQREAKKAQLSVLEIASCIIERVDNMGETNDYIYIGVVFSFLLTLIPTFCRLCEITLGNDAEKASEISYFNMPQLLWEKSSSSFFTLLNFAFGEAQWVRTVLGLGFIQRLCLTLILFIIFAVAERTFKQRFLYAKLFSHITSSRRSRKSNVPHFRLNKVRNIKTWLSVRSYLKKRGPQRSVDIIVSAAFIVTLLLLAFLSVEWLKDSVHLHTHLTLEALIWSITIGIYLLRFMTLGQKIQHKYRSVSVLITEQINLYLQIEQKPKKKDELMVSNSVLKLAADLLKELETPFKISGLSANPYLFTTIKVVILSALSGVLSEVLGFKLKLHKIKIK